MLLQSDDWGRVGVRDSDGFQMIRSRGLRLGENPYDLYSLETAEDVTALAGLLRKHRDGIGRSPCLMMNTCTANLDFSRMREEGFRRILLLPISQGLPGRWERPGLPDAYRSAIKEGLFKPALHGVTHFCAQAVLNALVAGNERAELLHLLWEADTPYIFWRMPWIGYEYWNPERPHAGFLPEQEQRRLIQQASRNFEDFFGMKPTSACAPGYRASRDTRSIWSEAGLRVTENGTDYGLRPPYLDEFELLHVHRTIDFEPSCRELDIRKYVDIAALCFASGIPAVISTHSINFHSTLKDFRSGSIAALDELLTALERRFPNLLYVSDEDLHALVMEGAFQGRDAKVSVAVTQQEWHPRLAQQVAF